MLDWFCSRWQLRIADGGIYVSIKPARLAIRSRKLNVAEQFFPMNVLSDTAKSSQATLHVAFIQTCSEIFQSDLGNGRTNRDKKTKSTQYVELNLTNQWARHFLVPTPKNARSMRDYDAALQKRFVTLYGDDLQDWCLQIEPTLSGQSLACAIASGLQAALQQVEQALNVRFISVQTDLIVALNLLSQSAFPLKSDDWIAHIQAKTMFLATLHGGEWQTLSQHDVANEDGAVNLPALLLQEALRQGIEAPSRLLLTGNDCPPSWQQKSVACPQGWIYSLAALDKSGAIKQGASV